MLTPQTGACSYEEIRNSGFCEAGRTAAGRWRDAAGGPRWGSQSHRYRRRAARRTLAKWSWAGRYEPGGSAASESSSQPAQVMPFTVALQNHYDAAANSSPISLGSHSESPTAVLRGGTAVGARRRGQGRAGD
jgi:hypothetical protein